MVRCVVEFRVWFGFLLEEFFLRFVGCKLFFNMEVLDVLKVGFGRSIREGVFGIIV